MEIYMDNGATTKVDKEVVDEMMKYYGLVYGNASSMHQYGEKAKQALENSRETIAKELNASPDEIIFTSGGTESNNFALKGIAFANEDKGRHIITTKIEHDCIINTSRWLEKRGFEVTYLDVDEEGFIDLKQLKKEIRDETILVSVIHANNEIGTVQNIKDVGRICKDNNVLFHTDACQSFTKIPIDTKAIDIDLITINSHKIHGPKGVGALYIKKGTSITPLLHGGGHEFRKRSGTENIPGIVGFAKAVEMAHKTDFDKIRELRDYMIRKISEEIPDTILTGSKDLDKRLVNNVNFIFRFIEGEGILMSLDLEGIEVSTGSACSSNTLEPSHVLLACGYKHELAHGSIRFTLSKYTTKEEVDYVIDKLKKTVEKLRSISPLVQR